MTTAATTLALGANSEVGTLRTVMVHRPGLARERLTPSNCQELLFDDVMHLDTVFTFCDRNVATLSEPVLEQIILRSPARSSDGSGVGDTA